MGSSSAPDPGAYTAQYEILRALITPGDARGGVPAVRAPGVALAVLLHDGLPAWLAAVGPLLVTPPAATVRPALEHPAPDESRPVRTVAPEVLPLAQHAEVTLVLAALVLSTARAARRDPSPARPREGACR